MLNFTDLRKVTSNLPRWRFSTGARWLLIPIAYLLVLTTSIAQVVISEVYANNTFTLQNNGNSSADLSSYWICDFPSYERLSSLTVECGSLNLGAGASVTLSGFSISNSEGELGLYTTNSFGNSNAIRAYVDWGSSTGGRAGVAVSAGIWTQGDQVSAFGNSESLQFDGEGNSVGDWSINANPVICPAEMPTAPANTARYRVTFDAFWSAQTHPTDFPGSSAHFSGLIGLTHSDNVSLFEVGGIASPGIVNMAETGGKSPLTSEIDAVIASGAGFAQINGGGIGVSPSSVSVEFDIAESHPLATVTSMIAPSPDWFVGVRDLNLFESGSWLNRTVTVAVYDAGSDSGSTFTSPNQSTSPPQGISMITDGPLAVNDVISSMGTLTFERIDGPATEANPCSVSGGTLTGGPFTFTVGDGVADNIAAGSIGLSGNSGSNSAWVVTDDQGNILGLPPMPSVVDFDGAGVGTCLIWHLSFEDGLQGAEVGKNASDLEGCYSLSNSIEVRRLAAPTCSVSGGTLTGGPFTFTVGDGVADNIAAGSIGLSGNSGANSAWVVTDDQGNILGLPPMPSVVDFDGAGVGTCLIWHLSFEDGLQGAEVGKNANDLEGCFSLSNSVEVRRLAAPTCSVSGGTLLGGPFTYCVDGTADNIPSGALNLVDAKGTNNQWVVTDLSGNILGLPPTFSAPNFDDAGPGVCLVWNLAYEAGLTGLAMGNNVSQLVGCYSFSNSVSVTRNEPKGGTLTGGPFSFTVGDGVADNIAAGSIELSGNSGANSAWVVTDDQGNILGLPPMPSVVDFDGAGPGVCLIWHLSFEGEIQGAEVGKNANDLQGCFSLSNAISVTRTVSNTASCVTPSEATITTKASTKYNFTWDPVVGANGYIIQFRLKGKDKWAVTAFLVTPHARVWARPNLDFEYRIKTVCGDGESAYSSIYDFSTKRGNLMDTVSESRSEDTLEADVDLMSNAELSLGDLEVAPNPFFEELNVGYEVLGEEATLSIYHLSGQKVFERIISKEVSTHRIELGDIPSGIFLLTIEEEGLPVLNRRIVKQSRF